MRWQRRIIQIVPANGWQAVYAIRPEQNRGNPVWVSALPLWALVEEGDRQFVIGLDSTLEFCDQGDNFLGYLSPGEALSPWSEKAERYLMNPSPRKGMGQRDSERPSKVRAA